MPQRKKNEKEGYNKENKGVIEGELGTTDFLQFKRFISQILPMTFQGVLALGH